MKIQTIPEEYLSRRTLARFPEEMKKDRNVLSLTTLIESDLGGTEYVRDQE
jgi:hypothetical protein